jgi:alkanesulfonate monooxygenase SsuD/methylene tetrahydromethanopterin reductase-like flavin-dependent oxidoreductase (luciferase family)
MKLGLFGTNVSFGCTVSHAETSFVPTYEHNVEIARKADAAGMEMLVPVGRWRGFGGTTDFNGENMEVYTWAAALATQTEQIMLFATSHVPTVHPILAAKQGATIDHISKGRFGLNIVSGWFTPEMEMFGAKQLEHDERYRRAEEWVEIVKRLWTEQDFDYEGSYYRVQQGYLLPKPVQQPYPVILNAGASVAGRDFSAREADFNFIIISDHEQAAALNREVRQKAAALGRECGVMTFAEVVCRDSEAEAQKDFRTILEKGDYEAATNILRIFGVESETAPGGFKHQQERLIAGWMGYPLIGTAEQIVDKLLGLSKLGIDGTLLSWLDYNQEIDQFNDEILPLMRQAGLRQ